MSLADIISIVGALGIGSILGQYVGAGRQRRELRARVLAALRTCEMERWVDLSNPSEKPFIDLIRDFEAESLVARIPRKAVVEYASLSLAASWVSGDAAQDDEEGRGGIPSELSDVVREAATLITDLTWHPVRSGLRTQQRTDQLRDLRESMNVDNEIRTKVERARQRFETGSGTRASDAQ